MNCGVCKEKPKLVKGVCPNCGADYAALADVFSIPVKPKPVLPKPKKG